MKKIMMILAGLMLMVAAIAIAEEQNIPSQILGGAEAASPINWDSETLVWKTGKIDFIDSSGVIIGDKRYQWSKFGVSFRGIDGKILGTGNFSQGTEVTFVLDSDRTTIVTLIKGAVQKEIKK